MSKEKAPAWVKKIQSERLKFWDEVYPQYTETERVHFWADELFSTMRTQAEVTGDPYSGFSKAWFLKMKSHEPRLSSILKKIVARLEGEIDSEIFFKRIKEDNTGSASIFDEASERISQLIRELSKQRAIISKPSPRYPEISKAAKLMVNEPRIVYKAKKKK